MVILKIMMDVTNIVRLKMVGNVFFFKMRHGNANKKI